MNTPLLVAAAASALALAAGQKTDYAPASTDPGTTIEPSAELERTTAELAAPDCAIDSARLRSAIAQLPPEQRSAIALFHLEEMSVAEVAVALDVHIGTVKTRLMHARRKLRGALEGE